MKMTKIESARIIVKQKGACHGKVEKTIRCIDCFIGMRNGCFIPNLKVLQLATAYIKRHESKTKKSAVKTDVRDVENVVKDGTVKESLTVDPTPLEIAKMIRDNKYNCNLDFFECSKCPLKPQYFHCLKDRKTLIDTYISDHSVDTNKMVEPVMPEPISIEELRKMICFKDEYIYYFNCDEKIGRVNTKHIYEMRITGKHVVMLYGNIVEAENYYKTFADAVRVAEKKWGVK